MESISLAVPVTLQNFDEEAYLAINPDVRASVRSGRHPSGEAHYRKHGVHEKRFQLSGVVPEAWHREKVAFLKSRIRAGRPYQLREASVLDFLNASADPPPEAPPSEDPISEWGYDQRLSGLLKELGPSGWALDCGAGWRRRYYRRIVNLEVRAFPSTDVLADGADLPFCDDSFDLVISSAVLEHVRDPFRCATELSRVLKPGGVLFCAVPFLQPYHAFPDHYYNMTSEGLKNLFAGTLEVESCSVYGSLQPISSLCWILQSWAGGLQGVAREQFLQMRVEDFLQGRDAWLEAPFVTGLSPEKQVELAAGNVLIARKPGASKPGSRSSEAES